MPKTIGNTKDNLYPIYIGNQLKISELLENSKILLVCDDVVASLHLEQLLVDLNNFSVTTLILTGGEINKNFDTLTIIINKLIEHEFDRNSTIISFGGGVIGDMVGFAAAIYMRGMKWVQIPTTLIAQVDSALGGKTGCNYAGNKNLIGVFYQPQAVIIDTKYLNTLPDREYLSGLAEVIKYGIALDYGFFSWLEQNISGLISRDSIIIETAIIRSCELKLQIVKNDITDHGERQKLNFGHTFGHAIEAATGFNTYLHGEAVAIGMCLASILATEHGLLLVESNLRIHKLIAAFGLPTEMDSNYCKINPESLYQHMRMDKKKSNSSISFVLPTAIGEVNIYSEFALNLSI